MPIVIAGDPVLHNPTKPVELQEGKAPSAELTQLINDMYETMDRAHGVGLAANQVGVDLRLFVYHCPDIEGADGERLTEEQIEANGGPCAVAVSSTPRWKPRIFPRPCQMKRLTRKAAFPSPVTPSLPAAPIGLA